MRRKLLLFGAALMFVASIGLVQFSARAASVDRSRDYDKYAIVYGGTMSIKEVRSKYSDKDHDKVFKAFGIGKSDLSGDIRKGVVYQDGRVVVDGKTVATDAVMAARHLGGSSIKGSSTAKRVSVSKMSSAQEALVKFNSKGEFEWAIMTPCGNPVTATPVKKPAPKPKPKPKPKAVYACDKLTATRVSGQRDTYAFRTHYTAKNGASPYNFAYDFGDGTTKDSSSATISHKYTQPGTYTATVTFQVKVKDDIKTASGDCKVKVTIAPEPCPVPGKEDLPKDSPDCYEDKPGVEIDKTVDSAVVDVDQTFTYGITVRNTGNVPLEDVTVSDPAPSGVTFISADAGQIQNGKWTHTIAELGVGESRSFAITAKVSAKQAGTIKNTACVDTPTVPGSPDDCDDATVELLIEVCDTGANPKRIIKIKQSELDASRHTTDLTKCNEANVPVCDPDSGNIITVPPSQQDEYEPKDSEACKDEPEPEPEPETPAETPTEMPTTGIADVLSGVFGIGSLTMTGYYYISTRRNM